jgi:hypothetical protein
MSDLDLLAVLGGFEDPRAVVAHEVAHQWWGHVIRFDSYRDAWISEAMANYAAWLYTRQGVTDLRFGRGPSWGWKMDLTWTLESGRTIESLGPLVLGERLDSSLAYAYQPVIYKKGAVVLNMLSRFYGQETFVRVLGALAKAVAGRSLTTGELISLVERITDTDLAGFADQFIFGTGLPEIYYRYQFEEIGPGRWRVEGAARQRSPYRFEYEIVSTAAGGFDVTRRGEPQMEVAGVRLAVPMQIAIHDPGRPVETKKRSRQTKDRDTGPRPSNALLASTAILEGEETPFRFEITYEPSRLWLDKEGEVFGLFFDESTYPKRMLTEQGLDRLARGELAEAESLLKRAVRAPAYAGPDPPDDETLRDEERSWDRNAQFYLARVYLETGREAEAARALETSRSRAGSKERDAEYFLILDARLALRRGDAEEAYRLLRRGVLKSREFDRTETLLVFAVAARETGRDAELLEINEELVERGVAVPAS